jgi:hypothetical protein
VLRIGNKVLKEVFNCFLNISTDLHCLWSLGSLFHNFGPIVLKLLSEKVLFLLNGTTYHQKANCEDLKERFEVLGVSRLIK